MRKLSIILLLILTAFSVFAEGNQEQVVDPAASEEMKLYHEQNCECAPLKNIRYLPYEWEHTVTGKRKEFLVSVCSKCGYKRILSQDEFTHLYAPYFGLASDIKPVSNPKTEDEFANNILYNWLIGNYSFSLSSSYFSSKEIRNLLTDNRGTSFFLSILQRSYCDLCDYYSGNIQMKVDTSDENTFKLEIVNQLYSESKNFIMILQGVDYALGYKRYMHETDKITEDMTETEIAKAYYTELYKNPGKRQSSLPKERNIEQLSVYSCLHLPNCYAPGYNSSCVGRAATYNMLMHLEGITSQTVHVPTHVVNRIIADGQEYVVDWGQYMIFGPWEDLDAAKLQISNGDTHGYPEQGSYMLFDGTYYKKGFVTEDKNK